jgi:hypothetical protein
MSHELGKDEPRYGTPHEITCTIEEFKAFQKIGEEMEIGVTVLATAGKKFIERFSKNGINKLFFSIVPEGKVHVEIANDIRKMDEFYAKAKKFLEQPKTSPKSS